MLITTYVNQRDAIMELGDKMRNYELLKKIAEVVSNRYSPPAQKMFRILDIIKKERPELLED